MQKIAGSCKTYIGKCSSKLGDNVLFVVPHNRLSEEVGGEATTKNMFFRIPVSNGDELPAFDHSPFNVIALSEIFMFKLYSLFLQ